MSEFFVGTSGFQYDHWNKEVWYPTGMHHSMKLLWHMTHFNALEINSSFYSIPKPERVQAWADQMPTGSKLILKAPQSVSHRRRMLLYSDSGVKDGIEFMEYFFTCVLAIPDEKRGPVLFQIPKGLEFSNSDSMDRLTALCKLFANHGLQWAFEIRHPSWYHSTVFNMLTKYNVALVEHDSKDFVVPYTNTADWHYVRRHGTNGRYHGNYSRPAITTDFNRLALLDEEVYVFYNNDVNGFAPHNAQTLYNLARQNGV